MAPNKMDIIRSMANVHITSVLPPFEEEQLYPRATRFLRRADAMGLLEEPIQELSADVVRRVARILSKRGLASGPGQFSTDEPPANCCLAVGRRAMSPHALSWQPPSPCKTSVPLKCHLHLGMDILCRDRFSGLRFAFSVSLDAERSARTATGPLARSWGGPRAIFCRYPHWRVGRVAAT